MTLDISENAPLVKCLHQNLGTVPMTEYSGTKVDLNIMKISDMQCLNTDRTVLYQCPSSGAGS